MEEVLLFLGWTRALLLNCSCLSKSEGEKIGLELWSPADPPGGTRAPLSQSVAVRCTLSGASLHQGALNNQTGLDDSEAAARSQPL